MKSIALSSVLSLVLFAPVAAAQGSDACTSAQGIVGAGPHAFDQTSATTGTEGQADANCNSLFGMGVENDVWFAWTAPSSDFFLVSSAQQTTVDTKIAVYPGLGCPPGASVGCDDDGGASQAITRFSASSGATYLIQVGTQPFSSGGTGTFQFVRLPTTANDDCAFPATVTGTGFFGWEATFAGTGTQGQANPFCGAIVNDTWFSWSAPITGMAQLDTCGQTHINTDTEIAVYAGTGCPGGTSIVCDDDACGPPQSLVQWPVTSGASYTLQIGALGVVTAPHGTFRLEIAGPPANDNCATPIDLGSGPSGAGYDNLVATTGAQGQGNPCGGIERDLWYTWTASSSGSATVETCFQTSVNTKLAVYTTTGCPAGTTAVCDDDGCGSQSTVTFPISAGATFTIQVGSSPGFAGGGSSFIITEQAGPSPMTKTCFPGIGGVINCPCGQPANPAGGCANFGATATTGAVLDASGNPSLAADTLVLTTTNHRTAPAAGILNVFFASTGTTIPNGQANGAGVRCYNQVLKRLYTGQTSPPASGSLSRPGMGDPSVSARSAALSSPISAGQTRFYFNLYRDQQATAPAACNNTTSNVNVTNAGSITWAP